MTNHQAICAIDDAVLALGFDEGPDWTIAKVSNLFPEYDRQNDDLLAGKITPRQYAENCISIVKKYNERRITAQLTKLLLETERENIQC